MAVQLYREGSSHTVRGIECELCNFEISQMEYQLKQGWVKSPEEIGADTTGDPDDTGNDEGTALNPVRVQAKEAGIEGWDKKRIGTLEAELAEL